MSEENLRNIGNQLIEAGKQLLEEAAEKDKAALLSLASQDVLSEFSWTFDLEDLDVDVEDWSLEGQPVGQQAKAFIDSITSQKGLEEIREQLGEDSLHLATCPSRLWLNVYPAKKFITWLKAHSHFQITNLPEALEALAPIIEERRIEHADLVELSSTVAAHQQTAENPISVDAVDWDAVDSGEQEAPYLILIKKYDFKGIRDNVWIYTSPLTRGSRWGWDYSKESLPNYGLTHEEAIARVNRGRSDGGRPYSALYRHLEKGIAELVYCKNQKDETEDQISVDAVDWDAVDSGEQEAPQLLNFKGDARWRRTALETGEWIYVGPPTMRTMHSYVWSWDNSKESKESTGYTGRAVRAVPYEEAIARVDKECRDSDWRPYSALYHHMGEGIAELVYSKNKKDETEYPYPISLNAVDWDEGALRLLNIKFQEPKN